MGERIVVLTPVNLVDKPMRALAGIAASAQPDLLYMDSILVSTGENLNDDVFTPDEMWKARNTPVLKPVDWEHETGSEVSDEDFAANPKKPVVGNQIIGVMYNTYTVDADGNQISDDKATASDFKIPEKFHIVDQAAIYKGLYPKTAAKIEKGAKENNLFVSMEVWFDAYDYLVGSKIVARNEQTAFLDKNLRAKGGSGQFGTVAIKRVLRNLTFGGKGIVYRPANKESVIKSVTSQPVQASASEVYNQKAIASNTIGELHPEGKVIHKESVMGDENKNMQPVLAGLTVEDYKSLLTSKAAVDLSLKTKEEELAKAKAETVEVVKSAEALKVSLAKGGEALESVLPGITAKLAAAKPADFFGVVVAELTASKAKADEVAKKLADAETKLAEAAKAAKLADRRSKIVAELKVEGEKLEKLMVATKDLGDEAFASYVASIKELVADSQALAGDAKKKQEEEEKKKKEAEAKAAADKAEADKKAADEVAAKAKASADEPVGITDPRILERIKASVTPSPGVDSNNKGVDLRAKYGELALAVFNAGKQ